MQPQNNRKKVYLIAGGAAAFLVLLSMLLLFIGGKLKSPNEVTVTLVVSPGDASITIDGTAGKAGEITLTKTTHTFKATRQYFGDANKTVDLATANPADPIYLILDANTPQAQQYLKDHPAEQIVRQRSTGQEIVNKQDALASKYPILQNLPYETTDYKIDYTVAEDQTVTFTVTLYTSYPTPDNQARVAKEAELFKKEALTYMTQNGLDPANEHIVYTQ